MPTWDESAPQYEAFEKKWHYYEKIAAGLVSELPVLHSANILELACGTGACTKLIARLSPRGKITALDSSKEMIRIAQGKIASLGFSNVTFLLGDVENMEDLFPTEEFDLALCNSAFWQFPDPFRVLTSLHFLLESGAQFAFNLPRWFPTDEARALFQKKAREILDAHGVAFPEKGPLSNQMLGYHPILRRAGFKVLKDSEYRFQVPRELTKEWQKIPVFSDQFRSSKMPQEVSDEIRNEFEKLQADPSQDIRASSWKIIVSENA